jgi:hypothetical protein
MSDQHQEIRRELDELKEKADEKFKEYAIRLKVVEKWVLILAEHAGGAVRKDVMRTNGGLH